MSRDVKVSSSSSGIGFAGLLTIVFIVLKLLKVINWSWWLVFLPLIISVGLFILLIVVVGIIALVTDQKGRGEENE